MSLHEIVTKILASIFALFLLSMVANLILPGMTLFYISIAGAVISYTALRLVDYRYSKNA